jgi:hypothetical protein
MVFDQIIQKSNETFANQILALLPIDEINVVIKEHNSDYCSKGFNTVTHVLVMVFSQMAHIDSLRELHGVIASAPGRFQELFMNIMPTKSTISYNNMHRDWRVFRDIFELVLQNIKRRLPRRKDPFKFENQLYSFDSTTISLSLSAFNWAHYRTSKGGFKVHTLLDNRLCLPEFVSISTAKEHDIKAARTLALPKGSIVAVDRGYFDYALFSKWTNEKIYFVIRPKSLSSFDIVETRELPKPVGRPKKANQEPTQAILDEIEATSATNFEEEPTQAIQDENEATSATNFEEEVVTIQKDPKDFEEKRKTQAQNKKNVTYKTSKANKRVLESKIRSKSVVLKDQYIRLRQKKAKEACPMTLRLVTVYDPELDREFQFLTNNFKLAPSTISDIYRDRWQVELFFKCLKQELVVKSFLGVSENAVRIQIYSAMIAILLIKYLQYLPEDICWNFSNLLALLRSNWFTYRNIYQWIRVPHCTKKPPIRNKGEPRIQSHKLF